MGSFTQGQETNSIRNDLDNTFPVVLTQSFTHMATATNDLTLATHGTRRLPS